MIELRHVFKRYHGGADVLTDINFTIEDGEMVFLTGPSGAGKSTLLKLIALIERPTRGQISVNGRDLAKLSRRRIPAFRREIGVVFQDNKLLNDRTLFDNVALPLIVRGVTGDELRRRVHAALDKVGLLARARNHPLTLSGGEQQRVGIARAITNRPPLLIADEPTGNLDAALSDEVIDLFSDFHAHGTTVLIATHEKRHIERLRKRVITLRKDHSLEAA
ncbi:MAG: cell division ATP-binding protein FtsE [Gammaproteobacteria bacterium]|nr:cell division ATP-binding protein FtsE [Gammaproteobacteria bacterium]